MATRTTPLALSAAIQLAGTPVFASDISTVLAHPILREIYSSTEHWQGNLPELGDALGTDCVIQRLITVNGRTWMRAYVHDGLRNSDWYGWNKDVLSPCECEVVRVNLNPVVNQPGVLGKPPASFLLLKRDDGIFFMLAHVAHPSVKAGDRVGSGQSIARVGNNGYSRLPHIHLGAWKGEEPLQIRFDQVAMGKLLER